MQHECYWVLTHQWVTEILVLDEGYIPAVLGYITSRNSNGILEISKSRFSFFGSEGAQSAKELYEAISTDELKDAIWHDNLASSTKSSN